jgi:hypothetical protein
VAATSDYDTVAEFLKRGGKPDRKVIAAARRVANRAIRLRVSAGSSVKLSPYMLSLLRLDRQGNYTAY